MADEDFTESEIAAELYTSPLQNMASDVHEIYVELERVGFPEKSWYRLLRTWCLTR